MKRLRSGCRIWNTYDLNDLMWTCHMDRVMDLYGGVWATIMEPIRIGRDTDYREVADIAEALEEAFHLGAREALAVAEHAFGAMERDQGVVIQIKEERRNGDVDEVLLPILPFWIQEEDLDSHRMIQALNVTLAAAQECEIEGSEADRTSIPGYML